MNQNDNLEQFFRKSLEGFSAEPSKDMWERIEPVIPPKPPIFGWWAGVAKWAGLAALSGVMIFGVIRFMEYQAEVEDLKAIVSGQQSVIDSLMSSEFTGQGSEFEVDSLRLTNGKDWDFLNSNSNSSLNLNLNLNSNSNSNLKLGLGSSISVAAPNDFYSKERIQVADNQLVGAEEGIIENQKESTIKQLNNKTIQHAEDLSNSQILNLSISDKLNTLSLFFPKIQVPLNTEIIPIKKMPNPFPRFSFEGKGGIFGHNFKSVYSIDSTQKHNPFESWQAGFLADFEFNSRMSIQTGFMFKNLKSGNTSVRYNHFPITTQYRFGVKNWVFGAKAGFALTTLIDAKSGRELLVLEGLKPNFFDAVFGIGTDFSLTGNTKLFADPWMSYSLSPAAGNKKLFQYGINVGVRYSIR